MDVWVSAENDSLNQELKIHSYFFKKRQSIDANIKTTKMVELLDKSFRTTIIKMLQSALKNLLERNEKKIVSAKK